jgi:hypothetical protein
VIEDAVVAAVEAERLRIGDEMDFVAENREFNAQLSGDNSRAAVRGVAGDSYAHDAFLIFDFDLPVRSPPLCF